MHIKISFCLFSLLVIISNTDAWTLKGIESIKDVLYTGSEGYDMFCDYCDANCKKAFCHLATTGESPLYKEADIEQGDCKMEALEIGSSININGIKCTDKYKDNKQLYIGMGPFQHSVAVYEKPTDGTGVLVGIMTDTPAELEVFEEELDEYEYSDY